jgi:hypothetical protein
MKKTLAVLIALMMVLPVAALAEETQQAYTVEITFDGSYVPFEEDGFQIYLPNEWIVYDMTPEWEEQGIFFASGSEDGSQIMMLSVMAGEGYELTTLAEELSASFTGVQIITINDIGFVTYDIDESNSSGMVALNENGYAYNFVFTPADDDEFMALAMQIMASIQNLPAVAE